METDTIKEGRSISKGVALSYACRKERIVVGITCMLVALITKNNTAALFIFSRSKICIASIPANVPTFPMPSKLQDKFKQSKDWHFGSTFPNNFLVIGLSPFANPSETPTPSQISIIPSQNRYIAKSFKDKLTAFSPPTVIAERKASGAKIIQKRQQMAKQTANNTFIVNCMKVSACYVRKILNIA